MARPTVSTKIVSSATDGIKFVQKFLYTSIDSDTILFLSGGKTPRDLYSSLAMDKTIKPGTVAYVDERYGESFHDLSNEKMIKDTGLSDYFSVNDIPVYHILQKNLSIEKTAAEYEKILKDLFKKFSKRVAVLGIGLDGHTAGLPANKILWDSQVTKNSGPFVTYYDDSDGFYKKRISMTLKALEHMDTLLVMVFGESKKPALELMVKNGSEEEVPARFFKRPDIAAKTLLITDQTV